MGHYASEMDPDWCKPRERSESDKVSYAELKAVQDRIKALEDRLATLEGSSKLLGPF